MEKLVQHPSLVVHSWHLTNTSPVKQVLIMVRELGLSNVILVAASGEKVNAVLEEVSSLE